MNRLYQFKAILHQNSDGDASYIEFPWDAKKEFGKDMIPVHATFD